MDSLKNVDWRGLYRSATSKVKQYALNLTPLEVKVEEATNSDTWGPHGSVMNEIAEAAFDFEGYRQVMGVIARRLQEKDENWRCCYKALLLLEHLLKHGPAKIVPDVQSSASVIERLTFFEYKDPNGRDHGQNVRHRAKEILLLLNSPDRMQEERDKAKANRDKYRGVSAAEMRMGGGFGGGSSSLRSGGRGPPPSSASFGRDRIISSDGDRGSLGPSSGGRESYGEEDDYRPSLSQQQRQPTRASDDLHGGGGGGADADAVAATRARIERIRLSGKSEKEEAAAAAAAAKKKLTDVKVNPRIAASLGLKLAAPGSKPAAPPAAAPAVPSPEPAAPAAALVIDLLGGLDDEPAVPPPAAAAAPGVANSGGWDAFGAGGAGVATRANTSAPACARAASPLDLLGDLSAPAPAPTSSGPPPLADFFAAPATVPPTGTGGFAAAFDFAASPRSAAAPQPPRAAEQAVTTAGVTSLPGSTFSDLTGIGAPQQPMGRAGSLPGWPSPKAVSPKLGGVAPAAAAGLGGFDAFSSAVPAPKVQSPTLGGLGGGFAAFGAAAPAPQSPSPALGGLGGGFDAFGAAAPSPKVQSPIRGGVASLSMSSDFTNFSSAVSMPAGSNPTGNGGALLGGTGRTPGNSKGVDISSLSYASYSASGARPKDPFDDLFK